MHEAGPELPADFPGGPEWLAAIEEFPANQRHLHTHEQHFVGMTDRDRANVTGDLLTMTTWTGTADEFWARLAPTPRPRG